MPIGNQLSDTSVLRELGSRVRRHRLRRNLTQQELADEAGVSKRTVERLEGGHSTQLSSFIRICRALGLSDSLDGLVPEPLPSPIEQLERAGAQRQRATGQRGETAADEARGWTWEDDS